MNTLAFVHATPAGWLQKSDLAEFARVYWLYLADRGYARHTCRMYLYGVAHFARWLTRCGVAACDLTDDHVRRFLDEHHLEIGSRCHRGRAHPTGRGWDA